MENTGITRFTTKYKIENGVLTWIKNDVTDFTVPEGVTIVAESAIHNRIKRIVFPDSVKEFYIPEDNNIEEIIFPKIVRQYRESKIPSVINPEESYEDLNFGLNHLTELKTVYPMHKHYVISYYNYDQYLGWLDKKVTRVETERSFEAEKIIIQYKSLEELLDILYSDPEVQKNGNKNVRTQLGGLSEEMKYIISIFPEESRNNKLVFVGPPIPLKYQLRIANIREFKLKKIRPSFSSKTIDIKKDAEEIDVEDEEIQLLINQIKELCNRLPETSKQTILASLDTLITNYHLDCEKIKPTYSIQKETPKLTLGTLNVIKIKLIKSLNEIISSLTKEKTMIQRIADIEEYKKIIDTKPRELVNNNNLKANIQNIVFYANTLDDKRKNHYLNRLSELLDTASKKIATQLSNAEKNIELELKSEIDYQQEFEMSIINLLQECQATSEKVSPYKKAVDCIEDETKTFENADNMLAFLNKNQTGMEQNEMFSYYIQSVRYVLHKLSDSTQKKELENSFHALLIKYKAKLKIILQEEQLLEKTDFKELEIEFSKEIKPILEQLRRYAYLDYYETKAMNKTNIYNQLLKSREIIEEEEQVEMDQTISQEVITSFVAEILNEILTNHQFSENIKQKMIEDLESIIDSYINELETNTVKTSEEYNLLIKKILKDIAKVKMNVFDFNSNITDYNKQISVQI